MGEWSLLSALPLVIGGACGMLALFAFLRRGTVPGSLPFGFLLLAAGIYVAASGMEHASRDLAAIVGWIKVEYLGSVFLGPLWLIFSLRFSGHRSIPVLPVLALLVEPCAVILFQQLPSGFSFFYRDPGTVSARGVMLFTSGRAAGFWIHQVYMSVTLLAGVAVLVAYARRASALYRANARIAVLGSVVPWLAELAYLLGVGPKDIDLGPYAIAVSGALFAWALFSRNLLDVVGAARERVMETMGDGVLVADLRGSFLDCNPAATRLLGLRRSGPAEAVALALEDPRFRDLRSLMAEGRGERELQGLGEEHDLEIRAEAFSVADVRGRPVGNAVLLADITQTSALLNQLQAQATLDGLTGAMNRRRFEELAARDLDLARRNMDSVALIMMDLDHFKAVNDSYGHAAGDEVLRVVCSRCKDMLRSTDLFCRFGGEEFALLLPHTEVAGARLVAGRLLVRIASEPIAWESRLVTITASFGVHAALPAEGETLDLYLRAADDALYRAKAAGRNRVELSDI
ncbi:MAG TPA: diguanylate cyclase [Rectinemataceae bacterium]|nr:diguanylate cyclase [Rectinemataceae bacterium]